MLSVDELISLLYFKCVIRAVELCDYGVFKVPACKHVEMKDVWSSHDIDGVRS